jgi:sec-independent protein translocase protein TatB
VLDLSPDKLLMLAVVALVVLGPNRLPGAARSLGRFLGQMRAMSSSFQTEVRDAIHEPHQAFTSALGDLRPADIRRSVRRVVVDTLSPPTGPDTAGANQVTPQSTNLAPGSASASSPGPATELSGPPPAGPAGPPPPDDPGFN